MKPKPLSAWLFMMIVSTIVTAQESTVKTKKRKLNDIGIAFTNSQPAMPFSKFSKLFTGNYHPGIELSTGFNWKAKPKHDLIQTFAFGYSYHRWVQHSIVLYTELGYRYKFPAGYSIDTKLGGGYMRAIVATEVFSDGMGNGKQYSKIVSGRSQGIACLSFSANKIIKPPFGCRIFLEYQQRFQTPFIQSYVPLLPYNIMKAGVAIPIKR